MIPEVRAEVKHGDDHDLIDYTIFINDHVAPSIAQLIDVDSTLAEREVKISAEHIMEMTEWAYKEIGMQPDEFIATIKDVFDKYDENNSGYLDPLQFDTALDNCGIELSEKEKTMLRYAADEDGNGQIDIGEFATIALQLMVKAKKEDFSHPFEEGVLGGIQSVVAGSSRAFQTMNDEELLEWLTQVFVAADTDGSGSLDRDEFKVLMKELNLSEKEALQVFAEADVDESGTLEYAEFIPLMVQVLQSISDMDADKQHDDELRNVADDVADGYMRNNMTPAEMELMMRQAFQEADVDGSGSIEMKEFKTFLRNTGVPLSEKEINMLFMSVDVDGSGTIDMEEFYPLFVEVMRMLVRNEALAKLKEQEATSG
jgi:Ca2+-binding EF-hand superfamily protein